MTEVYVVLIGSKILHPNTKVGACYLTEAEAKAEVKRLRAANSYTEASYVVRQVATKTSKVGWGHE